MRKPSLLFYCQHSLGMGHLVRSFALVRALAEQFHVIFLNGGRLPENVVVPSGVELVQLPPVGMNEDATLSSLDPELSLEECLRLREHLMLSTAQSTRPSAVIVELFPFGRKKFRGELVKLFDAESPSALKWSRKSPTDTVTPLDVLKTTTIRIF